jgi:hypothetical protein
MFSSDSDRNRAFDHAADLAKTGRIDPSKITETAEQFYAYLHARNEIWCEVRPDTESANWLVRVYNHPNDLQVSSLNDVVSAVRGEHGIDPTWTVVLKFPPID